jgi:hypothetical protein
MANAMPSPTPPAPSPWATHAAPSGLFKAGRILLLIGAILHPIGSFFLVVVGALMLVIGVNVFGDGKATFPFAVIGTVYLILGIVLAIGAVFGYLAHASAKAGQAHRAWVRGLVSSLLPPLQVVTLVGAILCMVSPEGEAQKRAQSP